MYKVILGLKKVNFINIYGPNEENPFCFGNVFLTVLASEGIHTVGGDFNCALDPVLDRSTQTNMTHTNKEILVKD